MRFSDQDDGSTRRSFPILVGDLSWCRGNRVFRELVESGFQKKRLNTSRTGGLDPPCQRTGR